MRVLGHYLLVNELKEQIKETKGGLLLAEKHREDTRYRRAVIMSIGHDIPTDLVKIGEVVWFDRHAGSDIEYTSGEVRKIIKLGDIVGVE